MAEQIINQEFLLSLFEYKDGELFWKQDRKANKIKGKKAGCLGGIGYLQTKINDILYKNHRLIFMMHYGYLPKLIDHIDGNPLNNRIENLREATVAQNMMNSKLFLNNTSGAKGVEWSKRLKKWTVRIQIDGKRKYFGSYYDIQVAKFVAETMRHKYHGKFANHGN